MDHGATEGGGNDGDEWVWVRVLWPCKAGCDSQTPKSRQVRKSNTHIWSPVQRSQLEIHIPESRDEGLGKIPRTESKQRGEGRSRRVSPWSATTSGGGRREGASHGDWKGRPWGGRKTESSIAWTTRAESVSKTEASAPSNANGGQGRETWGKPHRSSNQEVISDLERADSGMQGGRSRRCWRWRIGRLNVKG